MAKKPNQPAPEMVATPSSDSEHAAPAPPPPDLSTVQTDGPIVAGEDDAAAPTHSAEDERKARLDEAERREHEEWLAGSGGASSKDPSASAASSDPQPALAPAAEPSHGYTLKVWAHGGLRFNGEQYGAGSDFTFDPTELTKEQDDQIFELVKCGVLVDPNHEEL